MMNELKKMIYNRNVILFVGAGISATLGLPNWSELIAHISNELGYDPKIFNTYGDSLSLAEFYTIEKGHIGELRSWMETNWNVKDEKIKSSKIYDYILDLDFPIIYTTNYDHCIERAFELKGKKYKRIINVDDLVNLKADDTQIIKFHGDTISDKSIVLSESSYFERLEFNSPLDIKLKADMLGKSILFIGYSLSDINMRLLIYILDKLWKESNNIKKRPQSYIFLSSPNPIQEAILKNRGINTIIGKEIDKKESVENFLKELCDK